MDVFAFAVLVNECFAREVPWDGYLPLDIKAKVAAGDRPRLASTIPHALSSLVKRAWHQDGAPLDSNEGHLLGQLATLRVLVSNGYAKR